MKKAIQKGFTLIELMIVVAIIGILAAIAIPAYQDYTIRAQVTEGLNLMSDMKAGVAEWFAQNGKWPADGTSLGISAAKNKSGKYVTEIGVENGTLTAIFGNQANQNIKDGKLSLRPMVSKNMDVIWVCGTRENPSGAISAPNTTTGGDQTSLKSKYLPANCRKTT